VPLQTRTQKLASRQARSQLQVRRGLDSALPCFAADKRKYRADLRFCQPYQGVFFKPARIARKSHFALPLTRKWFILLALRAMTPRASRTQTAPPAPRGHSEWLGLGIGLASLLALLWACRGAPLGVPAADDYDYLAALTFDRPLDWLGPMGSIWYWRPLSRQLYFTVLDGTFFQAPLVVAAVHALLLVALFLLIYRAARTAFDPMGAAAIAAAPQGSNAVRAAR